MAGRARKIVNGRRIDKQISEHFRRFFLIICSENDVRVGICTRRRIVSSHVDRYLRQKNSSHFFLHLLKPV